MLKVLNTEQSHALRNKEQESCTGLDIDRDEEKDEEEEYKKDQNQVHTGEEEDKEWKALREL